MTYKKNVSNMVIAIVCAVLFVVTAFYCVPRFSLLSSNACLKNNTGDTPRYKRNVPTNK